MGRPIKLSDELYERLKKRAEENGTTFQDALATLLTEPLQQVEVLHKELEKTRAAVGAASQDRQKLEAELRQVRRETAQARSLASTLDGMRTRDVKVFNEWVPEWERIRALEDKLSALSARVLKLERVSHKHWGQGVEEEAP